ncbi:hypothetical protein G7076_04645 [Sphingomonas sp. HDW15A]|uniref:hypothetical protein n=1 Tax=Sphingomonas sp. HDW15A TaxID=2714942 RepID=UPI00140BBF79|nr:hypothetical protein [Sphingomonas sp. HDW15A]QIK95850.1 hypothetical protein G7076_04645 [Sphingomonas sp. HDW15A]
MLENAFWLAATSWRHEKDIIEQGLALDNAAIHVVVGISLFLVVGFLISRRNWIYAWLAVFAIAIWNEVVDIATERWPDITQQFAEAAFDLWATLAFPTVALLIVLAWSRVEIERKQEPL